MCSCNIKNKLCFCILKKQGEKNKGEVAQQYSVSTFLTIFVIDKEGKIICPGTGYDENIKNKIEQSIDIVF